MIKIKNVFTSSNSYNQMELTSSFKNLIELKTISISFDFNVMGAVSMEERMTSPSGWLSLDSVSKKIGHFLAQDDNVSNIGDAIPCETSLSCEVLQERTAPYDISMRFFAMT